MTKLFKYKAFGLHFESSFEIPELLTTKEADVDVTINMGEVPEQLDNIIVSGARFQANDTEFILTVDNIGRFYVKDGNKIVIEKKPQTEDNEMRLFLLGSTLGALFHQRGLLPLHASSIEIGDEAIALCGISGAGKSTLAASIVKTGKKLLADDISVITFQDGKPLINPAYPQMKLWADAVKYLGEHPGSYKKIRTNIEKHGVHFHDEFSTTPRPLRHIFVLSIKNSEGYEVTEVQGMEKFKAIQSNTYRFNFAGNKELRADHLKQSSQLAANVKITRIVRPRKGYHDKEIIEIINKQLQK
ncbi:MAG: hypothetical protein JXB49_35805 [Bacteroidales bacterium]|nr:hypothetical protein [Bacteroidales bacterium]